MRQYQSNSFYNTGIVFIFHTNTHPRPVTVLKVSLIVFWEETCFVSHPARRFEELYRDNKGRLIQGTRKGEDGAEKVAMESG